MASHRFHSLFGSHHHAGHHHGARQPSHPPRTSDTRNLAGLSMRSPSLRPAIEDKLQEDLPDDIEFLSLDSPLFDAPESYDELDTINERSLQLDDDEDDEQDDEDDMADWPDSSDGTCAADEGVSLEGIPNSQLRLEARQYKTPGFATNLLKLLREELKCPIWSDLPESTPTSQMSVHKVSGSLTNAVFFISFPKPETSENLPASILERLPPTVLLRIYGPSSGNLISRQKELHVLNTLSASYGIGPAIFGTFRNGRVEEYFESRALYKEELRMPTISRWIARRMRELHSVDLTLMELPPDPNNPHPPSKRSSVQVFTESPMEKPCLTGHDSSSSYLSTSCASSTYSIGSSISSSSGSWGSSYLLSPRLTARSSSRPGTSEGQAPKKKRSISSFGSRTLNNIGNGGFSLDNFRKTGKKPRSVVWLNIESWIKESKKVLKKVDKLRKIVEANGYAGKVTLVEDVNPLMSPAMLMDCVELLDLPSFKREVKKYRRFIEKREAEQGKSKRVFAHNDTQCGNLLRLTPGGTEEMAPGLRAPHEMIIVVDFEYAGVNPRAFDLANHFLEWRTDYNHSLLSHSVTKHGTYPSLEERQRFYRAYIPCDGGFDDSLNAEAKEPPIPPLEQDDVRVQKLEQEVQLWSASSHAMYFVWSIVQATDDIVRIVDGWVEDPESAKKADETAYQLILQRRDNPTGGVNGRPKIERGKSGEEIRHLADPEDTHHTPPADGGLQGAVENGPKVEAPQIGDFDYLSYAWERASQFRRELKRLDVL